MSAHPPVRRTLVLALGTALGLASVAAPAAPDIVPARQAQVLTLDLPAGDAQEFLLAPGGPYLSAEFDVGADARAVAFGNELAFVGGRDGLRIFDTAEGAAVTPRAQLSLSGPVSLVRVQGGTALLAGPRTLYVVDITDPSAPRLRAQLPLPRALIDLVIDGSQAWLLFERELMRVDLAGAAPAVQARVPLPVSAHGLAADAARVFIAAGEAGVLVLAAAGPAVPAGSVRTTGPALDVALADGKLYVADGDAGVAVFDANDDTVAPRWVGSFRRIPALRHIEVSGTRALAGGDDGRFYLLDVTRPTLPNLQAVLPAAARPAGYALGADAAGILAAGRLALFDLRPAPPRLGNEGLDFGQGVNLGGQRRVFIDGDVAYVADWFSGLHLYDLRAPRSPALLASFHTDGSSKGVVVRDGIAYVADDDHGLQILDVRDPRHPQRIAELPTPGLAYTPVLDGKLLYLAVHRGGFVVVDVGDPRAPRTLAAVDTPGKAWSLRVRDGILYVADDDSGLLVFDVHDPRAPRQIGRFSPADPAPGGAAEEVLLDGTHAYVAFFDRGVYVLDISDPAAPVELGHVATPGNARGLDRRGHLLYVADWLAGVQVVDVSDPRAPRLVGGYDTDGAAWGVQLHGDYAYVMDWWGGVSVLDATRPPLLRRAGGYPRRAAVRAVALQDRYAFVAQGDAGVQVFDIENPLNPTWMTGVDLAAATQVVALGERAYALHGRQRLAELDIADPYRTHLIDDLPLEEPARALYAAADRLLLTEERAVTLYDPQARTATRYTLPGRLMDAAYADGRFYLAVAGQGLRVATPERGHLKTLAEHAVAGDITRVRVAGARVGLAVAGEGVRLLEAGDAGLTEVARIPLPAPVDELQFDGDTLYIATGGAQVYAIDLTDPAHWRLLNRYGALGTVGGVVARGNFLYLTGRDTLTALQTLPPLPVQADGANRGRVELPGDLPAGAYDLVAVDRTASPPDRSVRRDAVTVEALRFGKPKITPEQFKALMEQYKKSAGQP